MRRRIVGVEGAKVPRYVFAMDGTDDDPFLKRLLRLPTGLRKRAETDDGRVIAVYCSAQGDRPFAIGRDGLLIAPDAAARFVPFTDIEESGYYGLDVLKREKSALKEGGILAEPLSLKLRGGEVIELPLDARPDGMSERLAIGRLVEQRVRLARAAQANS